MPAEIIDEDGTGTATCAKGQGEGGTFAPRDKLERKYVSEYLWAWGEQGLTLKLLRSSSHPGVPQSNNNTANAEPLQAMWTKVLCEQRVLWTSLGNSITVFPSQKFPVHISWKVSQFRNLLSFIYPGFPKLFFDCGVFFFFLNLFYLFLFFGVFFSPNTHQSPFQGTHFWKCHFNTLECMSLKCS